MSLNRNSSDDSEQYDGYESRFDPLVTDRKARRKRKPKPHHVPKKDSWAVLHEIADTTGLEGGFETTYQPGLFEEGWLLESVRTFYEQDLISDVLYRVRGGKEANVYCCKALPSVGLSLVAAKVYRPQMFRNLRNDKLYRDGRPILNAQGRAVKTSEHRIMRAIGKKTSYGEQISHTSWLMYEFNTLKRLYDAGASVPKPIVASENSILMSFHGDARIGAPTLNGISLDYEEVEPLFEEVMRNIKLMLSMGLIHGDLSAYNILYWRGKITLIDFPQVVNVQSNRSARMILTRDIQRVCEYFAQQGLERDVEAIADDCWNRVAAFAPLDDPELED